MTDRHNPLCPWQPRARRLRLWGLLAHGPELDAELCERLVSWEEQERRERTLRRRLADSHIGRFKPLADFDWSWPRSIDREALTELMSLEFLRERANVFLLGPNGTGKTMLAKNIAHHALLAGHSVRFTTASDMLNDLAVQDSVSSRRRRLHRYVKPQLLAIDELGYLAYDARFADLLYEVVSARHEERSTLVTSNRPFTEWNEVFPNAACVVTLVDRLTHCAEVLQIDGDSFRLKEATERARRKAAARASR